MNTLNECNAVHFLYNVQAGSPDDVAPVLSTPHHYLINIYRSQLYFVAVVTTEGNSSYLLIFNLW